MKIRRFVPDFVSQTGNTQITLNLKNYSNDTAASSSLGPFTITSSTTKVEDESIKGKNTNNRCFYFW